MSDIDRYVETFRQEAEELLADVEEIVLAIEDDPDNRENIDRLFRTMHTIKGSGSMFGFEDIAAFTHHVETALDQVRSGSLSITKELIDLILASRDQISIMLQAASGGPAHDAEVIDSIVTALSVLTTRDAAATGISSAAEQPESNNDVADGSMCRYRISFEPDLQIFNTGTDPAMLLEELASMGTYEVTAVLDRLPPIEQMDAQSCYLSWQIDLITDRGVEDIRDVFIFVEDTCKIEITQMPPKAATDADEPSQRLGDILVEQGTVTPDDVTLALSKQKRIGELLVDAGATSQAAVDAALAKQGTQSRQTGSETSDTLRVPAGRLDQLVNLVGELVISQARLTQLSAKLDCSELSATVEGVERLTAELRDTVLNIRMMPIGTTFGRFKRLVRDMSAELGKEIELITEGAETEMDKTVIDRLADPLVHLIRNSIDHGIEAPELRERAGKSRSGRITLAAAHVGTCVVVTIQDDGKGLDKEGIRKKAVEKGLISPDAELQESEIFSLIFHPGFSTAATVTNISGRGVGMDVVKREVEALRGSVSVSSRPGEGTTIDLSLPLTLAIIDGLLVEVDNERYVIPLVLVEECMELTDKEFALSRARDLIQVRDELVPLVRLREVFGAGAKKPVNEETVVVGIAGQRAGLVVDHVIGDHQIVIKSLGRSYRDVEGVSGATILGDGSVALILDVPKLVECAAQLDRQAALCA